MGPAIMIEIVSIISIVVMIEIVSIISIVVPTVVIPTVVVVVTIIVATTPTTVSISRSSIIIIILVVPISLVVRVVLGRAIVRVGCIKKWLLVSEVLHRLTVVLSPCNLQGNIFLSQLFHHLLHL